MLPGWEGGGAVQTLLLILRSRLETAAWIIDAPTLPQSGGEMEGYGGEHNRCPYIILQAGGRGGKKSTLFWSHE